MQDIYLVIAAILLWIFLGGLAFQRPNRQRLFWRLLAITGAVAGLLFLAISPTRTVQVNTSEAILLTPGYHPDSLTQFLKKTRPKPTVYSFQQEIKNGKFLGNLNELKQRQPGLTNIHLFGYGLPKTDLTQLQNLNIIPHLNPAPTGILASGWPKKITLGEALPVTGLYNKSGTKTEWLYLATAGKRQDSVQLKTGGQQRFTLKYIPKEIGQYIYQLQTREGKKYITAGLIPVQVEPKRLLKILLLPSGPNFETKFLKNYLAGQQHQVVIRTTISKDIYQTEWLNINSLPVNKLSSTLLNRFDLVITDPETLTQFNSAENQALNAAVQTDGLGLLILPTSLPLRIKPKLLAGFNFIAAGKSELINRNIFWAELPKPVAVKTLPFSLQLPANGKKITWNQNNSFLVGSTRKGWGTVAVSLLPQTFSWQLAGNKTTYTNFWAMLLNQVVKPTPKDISWHLEAQPFAFVNQPATLHLSDYTYTQNSEFPVALVSTGEDKTTGVYLKQNPVLPYQFTGAFWPKKTGWHQVKKPGSNMAFNFYVYPDSVWQTVRQTALLSQTKAFILNKKPGNLSSKIVYKEEEISPVWFFLLFLVSAGYLWLEEKL